ncbi:hypothetical protein TNCV_3994501 [Trichonephila clavipes]|nr:hypothetical protein TNCV_3994501 [Trichonephila clavipes]
MWFQLALYSDAPLLGIMIGSHNVLYFRTIDLAYLLGKKNGTMFAKRYSNCIVFGIDVLPLTQIYKYPRLTEKVRLVTRDAAYRIPCRQDPELAKKISNALDSGYANVQR